MNISKETTEILKNFATVNPSIAFKAGNKIRTVSEQKNILAEATVAEDFPKDFAIYELNQFLGLASLFENGEFDFGDKSVTLSEGKTKSRYTYTDSSMVTTPPEKNIELPTTEVSFKMTSDVFARVLNAANQLQLPEVVVRGDGNIVKLVATDTKNPTSNEFAVDVAENGATFDFVFKTENLKMIAGDYDVDISAKGISHFKGQVAQYWIATEAGSKYTA
ncbi:MAG: hypothetical protein H8D23_38585 [Candidatus Brocadiales bacterium]|nr:hypothetical protein [Candidatus Brocadiales bacterium]